MYPDYWSWSFELKWDRTQILAQIDLASSSTETCSKYQQRGIIRMLDEGNLMEDYDDTGHLETPWSNPL